MGLIGIDEVGRGCWAGPLVAGAVWLDDTVLPDAATWRLADSKILTKKQRTATNEALKELAAASKVYFGLGWVQPSELDAIGLSRAVAVAMRRAYEAIPEAQKQSAEVIIDGSFNFLPDIVGSRAIVKADGSIPAVSAASIMAKVARDMWMVEAAARFPGYGFERHVGYGTQEHQHALADLGICELHRRSFKPIGQLIA